MHELAVTTIRQWIGQGFRLDPLLDFDDLAELNRLAGAVMGEDGRTAPYRKALEPEFHMGGMTFRRLSIGVRSFIDEHFDKWFSGDEESKAYARVWCLAHGREPGLVWQYQHDPKGFCEEVQRWYRGLKCTPDELWGPLSNWYTGGEKPAETKQEDGRKAGDLSAMIEELASEYGKPEVGYWLWEVSEDDVVLMARKMRERKAREKGVEFGADIEDPRISLLAKYRKHEAAILTKLKARAA